MLQLTLPVPSSARGLQPELILPSANGPGKVKPGRTPHVATLLASRRV